MNIMNSLLRECEPDEVAVAFDLKHPTFRHEMYDGYKGTRHAMPDELAQQMPILKELLTDLATARYRQRAGRRTTFWARWPLPARPAGTTAFWPRETATACSW